MEVSDLIQVCVVKADRVITHDFRENHDHINDEVFENVAKLHGKVMSLGEYQDYINGTMFSEDDRIRFTLKIA